VNRFVAVRAGYGAILLLAPDRVSRWATGRSPDRTFRAAVRILGARHLTQAVMSIGASSRVVQAVGAEVDALHSLSMLGLAARDPAHRRSGVIDAVAAGCFAAVGTLRTARLPPDQAPAAGPRGPLLQLAGLRARAATGIARRTLPTALFDRLGATNTQPGLHGTAAAGGEAPFAAQHL
jgi:hypothetical protein